MVKIYHNPRCRKSREALQMIEDHNIEADVILYLETPPAEETIADLIKKSEHRTKDFVRTNETEFKENFKGKNLSDEDYVAAIARFPKILQRPIVETKDKAIIARDHESFKEWLKILSLR